MVTVVCVGKTNPCYKTKVEELLVGVETRNTITIALSKGNTASEVDDALTPLPYHSTVFWSPNEEYRGTAVKKVNAVPVRTLEELLERVMWLDGHLGGYG